MGGVRVLPDLALADLRPGDSSLLILTGASLWDTGEELAPFAAKAGEFLAAGVPVAAICGATAGLARAGLLDGRAHTSGASFYLAGQPGYGGRGAVRRGRRGHRRRPDHGGPDGTGRVRPGGLRAPGRLRAGGPGRVVPALPRLGRERVPGPDGGGGIRRCLSR
ncbi:hypothetical protein GCM10020254_41260 [Streptomyces goshikiensis]